MLALNISARKSAKKPFNTNSNVFFPNFNQSEDKTDQN